MLAVSHTIASAAIGTQIENPALAFTLAFTFHFFCDWLLHWNFYPGKWKYFHLMAVLDVLIGLLFAFLLLGKNFGQYSVLAAIIGGLLPDIIAMSAFLIKRKIPIYSRFHDGIQNETESFYKGIISQVIVVAISVLLILLHQN